MANLSIRIDFGTDRRIGPGKIELLEHVASLGSIAAGGRALGMSYRRAGELIDDINKTLGHPVLTSKAGGHKGGGAVLTPLGLAVISRFRAVERAAKTVAQTHLRALEVEIARKPSSR